MTSSIILGDPHIGKNTGLAKFGIGVTLNSRIVDQMALLDWVLEQASLYDADNIIITGDVFEDPKPAAALITQFISWLKRCQVHGVHVHIIVGNHDITRNGFVSSSSLDIISEIELDNVSVYRDINSVILGTTAFTLLPFRDRKSFCLDSNAKAVSILKDSLIYELASIPVTYTKVLIGHLAIAGSIPIGDEMDDITNEIFCPLDMFTGYDYVWMGHIHKPQVMQRENPYISHIGSMDLSNFGETDHKKQIVIFDCDTGEWEYKILPTRPLQKICITVPKDTEDSTQYVLDQIEKAEVQAKSIVRVEISLSAPELKSVSKASIEKFLKSKEVFSISGILETKKVNIIKKDSTNNIDTKMDVPSAIKAYALAYIAEEDRDEFIEMAMVIYNDNKPEDK